MIMRGIGDVSCIKLTNIQGRCQCSFCEGHWVRLFVHGRIVGCIPWMVRICVSSPPSAYRRLRFIVAYMQIAPEESRAEWRICLFLLKKEESWKYLFLCVWWYRYCGYFESFPIIFVCSLLGGPQHGYARRGGCGMMFVLAWNERNIWIHRRLYIGARLWLYGRWNIGKGLVLLYDILAFMSLVQNFKNQRIQLDKLV